jgi:transposase
MIRIALGGETRKALVQRLQQAYATHPTRLVRRIHVLLALAEGKSVDEVAQLFAVGEQTIRDWRHAFVLAGVDSLFYRPQCGRPAKLTA